MKDENMGREYSPLPCITEKTMTGSDKRGERGMELQAHNRGHSGPFIIRNEGVTNGLLILDGTTVNFVTFTSNKSTEPSHLSYELHYIS